MELWSSIGVYLNMMLITTGKNILLNIRIYKFVLNLLTLGMLITAPFTAMSVEAVMYGADCGSTCCCTGLDRNESANGFSRTCNCRMEEAPSVPPAERALPEKPKSRTDNSIYTSVEEGEPKISDANETGIHDSYLASNYKQPPIYLSNHSFLN